MIEGKKPYKSATGYFYWHRLPIEMPLHIPSKIFEKLSIVVYQSEEEAMNALKEAYEAFLKEQQK